MLKQPHVWNFLCVKTLMYGSNYSPVEYRIYHGKKWVCSDLEHLQMTEFPWGSIENFVGGKKKRKYWLP